jgi:hypothetical protein
MSDDIIFERDGVRIVFEDPCRDAKGWLESFRVSLASPGFSATARIENPPYGRPPSDLFEDLAQNWKGWAGEKKWRSMEDELTLIAVRDSVGHIFLTAKIHSNEIPAVWSAKATVMIDAGQLEQISRTFLRFFEFIGPEPQ